MQSHFSRALFIFLTLFSLSTLAVTVTSTGELNYSYHEPFYNNKPETVASALQNPRVSDEQKGRLIIRILMDKAMPQTLRKVVLDPDLARSQPALIPYVLETLYAVGDAELYRYIKKPVIIPAATEFLFYRSMYYEQGSLYSVIEEMGKLIRTKGSMANVHNERSPEYLVKVNLESCVRLSGPVEYLDRIRAIAYIQYFRELTEAVATFDFSLRSETFRTAAVKLQSLFYSEDARLLLHLAFDSIYKEKSDEEFDSFMAKTRNWGNGGPACEQLPNLKP